MGHNLLRNAIKALDGASNSNDLDVNIDKAASVEASMHGAQMSRPTPAPRTPNVANAGWFACDGALRRSLGLIHETRSYHLFSWPHRPPHLFS